MENIKNGMKKKVKKYDKLNSLVADVLKDFKRIIYRAKQLNYAWNKDPLIFKAYEGPLDWKSKLAVLKKIQPDVVENLFTSYIFNLSANLQKIHAYQVRLICTLEISFI